MLNKDIEEFIKCWFIGYKKVFYYKNNLYTDDIIVIKKVNEDQFEVIVEFSTSTLNNLNGEDMTRLIAKNELTFFEDFSIYRDYKYFRSNGCICGDWINGDNATHSFGCPLRNKG